MKARAIPFSVGQIVALTDPWSGFRAFRGGIYPNDPCCGIWGSRNPRHMSNLDEAVGTAAKLGNIPEGGQGIVVAICGPKAFSAEAGVVIRIPMERGWVDVFYHQSILRHVVPELNYVKRINLGVQDTRFKHHYTVLSHLIAQQGCTWAGLRSVDECYRSRMLEIEP